MRCCRTSREGLSTFRFVPDDDDDCLRRSRPRREWFPDNTSPIPEYILIVYFFPVLKYFPKLSTYDEVHKLFKQQH